METQIFNARLDAAVCGLFLILVGVVILDSLRMWAGILSGARANVLNEAPYGPTRLEAEEQ